MGSKDNVTKPLKHKESSDYDKMTEVKCQSHASLTLKGTTVTLHTEFGTKVYELNGLGLELAQELDTKDFAEALRVNLYSLIKQ